ncbi:MAG: nucleoside deaminase [Bacteroidales bacterium]
MNSPEQFLREAIELARANVERGKGGPFAAIVVRNGEVIAAAANSVTSTNDPTAHAEVNAIREACRRLGTFQLDDCEIYTSCEPCPMCLGAIYWARLRKVYFAATKVEASEAGFDDDFIYREIEKVPAYRSIPFIHVPLSQARLPFKVWSEMETKISY